MFRQPGDLRALLLQNGLPQRLKIRFCFLQARLKAGTAGMKKMAIETGAERGVLCDRRTTLAQFGKPIVQLL